MVKVFGNYTDNFIVLNQGDNLIHGGCDSETTFFIKKDGSSSFGAGQNGNSFKALLDTPNKIKEGGVLGGCGDKITFVENIDVDNIVAEKVNTKDLIINGILKVVGEINNIGSFSTKSIQVQDILKVKTAEVKELHVDNIDCKLIDSVKVKCGEIFCDDVYVNDIELGGFVNKPTAKFGNMENPVSISAASSYEFDLGNNNRMEIIGKHFQTTCEFVVKTSEANVCLNRNVLINVMSLYGDELTVVGQMIKQRSPYEILVRINFDKLYKNDIIEKIVIDII